MIKKFPTSIVTRRVKKERLGISSCQVKPCCLSYETQGSTKVLGGSAALLFPSNILQVLIKLSSCQLFSQEKESGHYKNKKG